MFHLMPPFPKERPHFHDRLQVDIKIKSNSMLQREVGPIHGFASSVRVRMPDRLKNETQDMLIDIFNRCESYLEQAAK